MLNRGVYEQPGTHSRMSQRAGAPQPRLSPGNAGCLGSPHLLAHFNNTKHLSTAISN